ncbi:MAG: aminopeptidase N [Proteobacteria bacterium]|nr:aminopeptidase N [Pseudomonadota bacterium]
MRNTLYLKDYLPADFVIDNVHIHVDLHEADTVVKSVLNMRRNNSANNPQAPLVLDGEDLSLRSVYINGHLLSSDRYELTEHHLTISDVPDQFILETEVVLQPQKNTKLSGLYKSRTNFCTQCEAHGFRRITYYLDRPDVMSRFTTTISADQSKYPYLLSNGNLIATKQLPGGRHWVHWQDPSLKPAYLFALVAGDFDLLEDHFVTQSGRRVELKMYLEQGFKDQGDFALIALKHAMRWDEQTFGREYDLDIYMIVAVSDFNMGAMENKGLNIFNTKYILAKPETATDQDYAAIESVIGHEYFHNWSGNRVTCRDWFQITLKEGLTVLRQQLFDAAMTSPAVARIDEINLLRNRQFLEDDGPNAHSIRPEAYIEVNNFYTATVYYKGAEVIRMIRTLLGPELFRQGMDLYFSRHDGQAVTVEDFVKAMADVSHQNFDHFFRWYRQSGTPTLEIQGKYNPDQKQFKLSVKQVLPKTADQSAKKAFYLPLAIGLVGKQGMDLPLQLESEPQSVQGTKVLVIKDLQQEFIFTEVPQEPVPSLLRNFSAPVKFNYPYDLSQLAFLMVHDSDVVARWEASQQFAVKIILELVGALQNMQTMQIPHLWFEAYSQLIDDHNIDLHLLTRLLTLPTEGYLTQYSLPVDVDNIHLSREFAKQQLATELHQSLLDNYHRYTNQGPYVYNTKSMGQRSIKNLCLSYLVETGQESCADMAMQQFRSSNNMTDTMGALLALNNYDGPQRRQALAEFHHRWRDQPLVVNKWLALHASSQLPDTLTEVQTLLKHPAFSIQNPNNVYNLIGVFAANLIHFHADDGSGYQFIADQVIAIDPKNPQVAARIVEPLTRWQKFDQQRQDLMRLNLQRIQSSPHISSDVYELVMKSLKQN